MLEYGTTITALTPSLTNKASLGVSQDFCKPLAFRFRFLLQTICKSDYSRNANLAKSRTSGKDFQKDLSVSSGDAILRSTESNHDTGTFVARTDAATPVAEHSLPFAEFMGGLFLLMGATAWAYATSFDGVRILDDEAHIQPKFLSGGWLEGSITNRPLVQASLVLNYRLGGMDLWGYHAFNLLVHILTGCLLFGIVRRTLGLPTCQALRLSPTAAARVAWASALIWLLHPLNTQSVTYVIQRCESLAGLFTLGCLYAAIRGSTGTRSWLWYCTSILSFGLALASKQNAMTTPLILLAYDFVFLRSSLKNGRSVGPAALRRPDPPSNIVAVPGGPALDASWSHPTDDFQQAVRPTVREIIRKRGFLYVGLTLVALAALPGLWTILMAPTGSAGFHTSNVTPWKYARSQPGVILHYLRLAVWPDPLCLDYRWMVARSLAEILIPGLIMVALFAASLWATWRRNALGFLGLTFFLLLAPTSSFAPLADLAFEHRMYLPLACVTTGLVCLFVQSTLRIAERRAWPAAATAAFLSLMLVATSSLLGMTTSRRNLDYQSRIRLWTSVVRVRPMNYRGWSSLGVSYDEAGDQQRARECFERAIAIHDRDAGSLLGLGLSCLRTNELDRARWAFERGLEVDPKMVDAAVNLGVIAARLGDHDTAIKHFDRAIAIQPEFSVGHYNRADSLSELGRDAEAVESLQTALRIDPDFLQAARKLARIRSTSPDPALRDGPEAVQLVETKCQLTQSQSVHTWDTYGAALAEVGRFEEAVRAADRAIELATAAQKTQLADEIALRRNIYRTHQPYRVIRPKETSSSEMNAEPEVAP